jgi:DNA-binding CsgD family transcriptional regulator
MKSPDLRAVDLDDASVLDAIDQLSRRERHVITLISRGLTNQEISETLILSINSVKTYIRTGYRRLGITSRSHAVIWGIRNQARLAELGDADARAERFLHAPGHPLRAVQP